MNDRPASYWVAKTKEGVRKPHIRKVQGTLCMLWLATYPKYPQPSEYALYQAALRFTYRENQKAIKALKTLRGIQ